MSLAKTKLIDTSKPFARLQFVLIAAVVVLTGVYTVRHIFAASASLSFVPSVTSVNIGDNVTVGIHENSGTDAVNTVEADVAFDATKLQYVGVSETGSAFGIVASTTTSTGQLNIARGVNGGTAPVSGDQLVTTVTFKALAAGPVQLGFNNGSAVVRASDSTNILAATNPLTLTLADLAAPTVPANLAAPAVNVSSVGLTWDASTDNVATTGYRIFRNGVQAGKSAATNYTDTGLLPNTSYTFTVSAEDAAGNVSAQTAAITVRTVPDTVPPTTPGIPTSTTQTDVSITLTWAASTDNVGVTSYEIYRNATLIATPSGNNFVDTGLLPNTAYVYTVMALDYSNNKSAASPAATIKTLPDTTSPTVPTGLTGSVSGQTVTLSWTASQDDSAVGGYIVYRDGTQIGTSVLTKVVITNAATGNHVYTVAAFDTSNNKSAPSTGVTLGVWSIADINHDGKVDVFDLSSMLNNWAHTGVNPNDLNGDSIVNVIDLSILLSHWTG